MPVAFPLLGLAGRVLFFSRVAGLVLDFPVFQGQLAGRLEPLVIRAKRLLAKIQS